MRKWDIIPAVGASWKPLWIPGVADCGIPMITSAWRCSFETIKIGANRVELPAITPYATNEPAITGGYIFKKDKDSAGDLDFSTAGGNGFPRESLKLHDPKPNELRATPVTGPLTAWGSNVLGYLVRYL